MIPVTRTRVVVVVAMRELVFNCSSDTAALENEEVFGYFNIFCALDQNFIKRLSKQHIPPIKNKDDDGGGKQQQREEEEEEEGEEEEQEEEDAL
jgi:hypothetical protein